MIESPQVGNGALLGFASGITVRLDELDVAIGAAAGEFNKHATTLSQRYMAKFTEVVIIAPLQN